jgi:ABC-type branched-subunit amino acid transport system substrate-binding protein
VKQLEVASIEVLKPAAFEPGAFRDAAMSEIGRSGFRIVLVLSYDADAQTVASLGRRESMTTGWAWLVLAEMLSVPAMAGWLSFRPFLGSGTKAFAKQVSDYSMSHFNISVRADSVDLAYSAALYDAIMLYAYSATKVLSEGGDLRDGEAVTAALRNTTIEGVGGSAVALDSNGDRIQSYEVMNYVLEVGDVMGSVAVGIFNSTLREYKVYERAVVWPGSTMEAPADYFSGE